MLESLLEIDQEFFLTLNGFHNDFFDSLMFQITRKVVWIPLFLLIVYSLIKEYKKESVWIIVGALVLVGAIDLLNTELIKPWVGRLRPSRDESLEGLVHLVNGYRGGKWSFMSGHAATSFGLAYFLHWNASNRINWIPYLFAWALLFSYSRIYLGVHYPFDIICGIGLGMLLAYGMTKLYQWFIARRAQTSV